MHQTPQNQSTKVEHVPNAPKKQQSTYRTNGPVLVARKLSFDTYEERFVTVNGALIDRVMAISVPEEFKCQSATKEDQDYITNNNSNLKRFIQQTQHYLMPAMLIKMQLSPHQIKCYNNNVFFFISQLTSMNRHNLYTFFEVLRLFDFTPPTINE